jgi:hypothetical protein
LPIYGGAIIAYSPTALKIDLSSSLNIPAGLTVDLDPLDLFLYNKNASEYSPYTAVSLPGYTIKGYTPITVKDNIATITNETELVAFLNNVFGGKTATLSAKGSTTAHLGAIKAHVELDKTIEIAALNNLAGFGLSDTKLVLPAEADGTNIIGNLSLPNWSALTLGLGNVTLNAHAGQNLIIGKVSMLDVMATPGNNSIPFRGEIYLDVIVNNLIQVILANTNALKSGAIAIGASGNSTIVNGQHIPYLESVLNSKYLVAQIPILDLLGDVLNSFIGANSTSSISGLLSAIESALNSSGLSAALTPLLSTLNLTQAEEVYKREVLGQASIKG